MSAEKGSQRASCSRMMMVSPPSRISMTRANTHLPRPCPLSVVRFKRRTSPNSFHPSVWVTCSGTTSSIRKSCVRAGCCHLYAHTLTSPQDEERPAGETPYPFFPARFLPRPDRDRSRLVSLLFTFLGSKLPATLSFPVARCSIPHPAHHVCIDNLSAPKRNYNPPAYAHPNYRQYSRPFCELLPILISPLKANHVGGSVGN